MSTPITIDLPDEIYHQLQQLAQQSNREVAEILSDTVSQLLLSYHLNEPMSSLSDEQVLALTQLQMDSQQDYKLSTLLDRQREDNLTELEQSELHTLMQVYQTGLLRKTKALNEAVKRGLIDTPGKSSLPKSVGMGSSGRHDLSSRCEELLWNDEL